MGLSCSLARPMNDPHFGVVFKLRKFDTVRAMLIGQVRTKSLGNWNWNAMVLHDTEDPEEHRWPLGSFITIAPEGDHCIEIAEDDE